MQSTYGYAQPMSMIKDIDLSLATSKLGTGFWCCL